MVFALWVGQMMHAASVQKGTSPSEGHVYILL